MRKLSAVVVLVLSGALTHAPDVLAGENISFGVLGGLSRVDVSAEPEPDFPLSSRNRAHAGGFVQFDLNESASVVAQTMWLQKGTALGADPDEMIDSGKASADFIGLPVLLKLTAPGTAVRPYLVAGAEIDFKLSASLEVSGMGMTVESENFEDDLQSIDVALDIGGGVEIPAQRISIILEALYSHGIRNLARPNTETFDSGDELKTRAFRFSVGVRF